MTESFVKALADPTTCDQEPIHIPGSIQPFGFMLITAVDDHVIRHASANLEAHLDLSAEKVIGLSFFDIFPQPHGPWLKQALLTHVVEGKPIYLGTLRLDKDRCYDVLAHRWQDCFILEFEFSVESVPDFRFFSPIVTRFVGEIAANSSIETMSDVAVREIKQITGFGRVLLYRFDQNQHGEVLAEALDDGYHSYLNQHFPASDIPQQARALYISNRIRLIADVNYEPVRLVPQRDETGQPIDLSQATLRSVSPVHVDYMRNMGTQASMSISIAIRGRLWGMISCHDNEPRRVPFEIRAICEQLGQILAVHFEAAEERKEFNHRLELRGMLVSMLAALSQSNDFSGNISSVSDDLLKFANASGAALIQGSFISVFGTTPGKHQINELVLWLSEKGQDDLFHTESLSKEYPAAEAYKDVASGILAVSISQIHKHYLIWFRPEVVQTIDWAGNPYEKLCAANMATSLSPRRSFELWQETVRATSIPWRPSEMETALEFRTAILGIVLQRAEEMAELAEHLGRVNKELESFSYSVSHDLRSPLRHIAGFADLLLEMERDVLSEKGVGFLGKIKSSAHFAGKLVDDLLSFSQMGRSALNISSVNMNELIEASMERLSNETAGRKIAWNISALPVVQGDPTFLSLAVYNLLSNAVKYSRDRAQAVISIDSEQTEKMYVFHVRDNGVGFDKNYVHKLFGVFQRLHRMEEFEGTGIGLANVKRIIERHGGAVWADSTPNEGSVFSFSLPKKLQLEEG
ncbi:ATP-binding protein [uncultured Oxalicibacterium sp.]|uniref:ATP-binding protein n=1 Tax=uncultured Oxalicibacterium sp. TaxID=1168540 RepID=UPI0025DD504D|nr:ATP-binding protein [uncultured Oxalicibacterium sp.]